MRLGWVAVLALTTPASAQEGAVEHMGVARDGKGRALLVSAADPVTLEGLSAWPAAQLGALVRVRGEATVGRFLPEATVGPDGEVSQGVAPGSVQTQLGVEEVTVLLAPPWTLAIDGGSHDTLTLARSSADGAVTWATSSPPRHLQSSQHYEGYPTLEGPLDDAELVAMWAWLGPAVAQGTPAEPGPRSMGTARLHLTTGGERRELHLGMGATRTLEAALRAWLAARPEASTAP